MCVEMLVTALVTIAKTWKRRRYSSVGEWMDQLWDTQTVDALKGHELSAQEKTGRAGATNGAAQRIFRAVKHSV